MKKVISLLVLSAIVMVLMAFEHDKPKISDKSIVKLDSVVVTATIYRPGIRENGVWGNTTASGFKIKPKIAFEQKIIAISYDLRKKLPFGSKIILEGAGKFDGIYTVQDLMHSKWKKRIDILVNRGEKSVSFKKIKLYKIEEISLRDSSQQAQVI